MYLNIKLSIYCISSKSQNHPNTHSNVYSSLNIMLASDTDGRKKSEKTGKYIYTLYGSYDTINYFIEYKLAILLIRPCKNRVKNTMIFVEKKCWTQGCQVPIMTHSSSVDLSEVGELRNWLCKGLHHGGNLRYRSRDHAPNTTNFSYKTNIYRKFPGLLRRRS